eukprot:CAMPEP_0196823526 /NCGR_PEP_ID=MMETSP1362-20130617/87841_1 /TAXON_ID=163516 /ORGANISM="Leptocylindrus danicus, Strain CCMP1856" /LENGTH=591 /DNA_ID=CAMNT_0042203421 /DNA_START=99 /DNA_END=1871 /DNA_ORIENTATION=+
MASKSSTVRLKHYSKHRKTLPPRLEPLVQDLHDICRKSAFRHGRTTSIVSLQQSLNECFLRLLSFCTLCRDIDDYSHIIRYDDICIELALVHSQGIDWKCVCEEYEQCHEQDKQQLHLLVRHTEEESSSSSLSSNTIVHTDTTCLLSVLLDVLVYSMAKVAAMPVVLSLIRIAACTDYTHDCPNARQRILQSIEECLESFPAMMLSEGVSRIICSCIFQSRESATYCLEVAKWLILRRPSLSPDLCVLVLNIAVAHNAVPSTQDNSRSSVSSSSGARGSSNQEILRSVTSTKMNLAEINGTCSFSCDVGNEMTSMLTRRNTKPRRLMGRGISRDCNCLKKCSSVRNMGQLLCGIEVTALFLEILAMFDAAVLSSTGEYEIASTFHTVVSTACTHPRSNLAKACAVSFAARGKELGCSTLFQRIWGEYLNSANHVQSDALLRMYSELVVDCAIFDSDENMFWTIVKPLLERARCLVLSKESDANNVCCVSLIRTVGYIFTHRHYRFAKDCIYYQVLSEIFARKDLWMNNHSIPLEERIELSYSLRSAGILSLLHADGDLPQAEGVVDERWPFEKRSRLNAFAMDIPYLRTLL